MAVLQKPVASAKSKKQVGATTHKYKQCPTQLKQHLFDQLSVGALIQHSGQANSNWNTDSEATAHMTPHLHWLRDYKPFKVPIKLADDTVIFSSGVGSILFKPFVNSLQTQSLLFTRVLHVPQLQSNLLSVLFLIKHKGYTIHIDSDRMYFNKSGRTLFTATINSSNTHCLYQSDYQPTCI